MDGFSAMMNENPMIYSRQYTSTMPKPDILTGQLIRDLQSNSYTDGNGALFDIRGPNYLQDRIKIPSQDSVCKLVDLDLFRANEIDLYTSFEFRHVNDEEEVMDENVIDDDGHNEHEDDDDLVKDEDKDSYEPKWYAKHPMSFVSRARELGDQRIFFVVHFDTGMEHLVATFVPNYKPDSSDCPEVRCWERFISGDADYRNARFKIIPYCLDGPWLVKKTIGLKPAIIGKKINCYWKDDMDSKVIEFYCDIASSIMATTMLGIVKSACKSVVLDLAFLIEAQEDDELPERILGVARLTKVDMDNLREL